MAKSSSRIRMPDSFRVNQPTLSKKTWMGSLQQRTAEVALPLPETVGGQHCWPSTHWTSPQLCRAWQAEIKHPDRKVLVVPPPSRRGVISGSHEDGTQPLKRCAARARPPLQISSGVLRECLSSQPNRTHHQPLQLRAGQPASPLQNRSRLLHVGAGSGAAAPSGGSIDEHDE
uniref:Uncharacterized protein n=1 Tax=Nothobranchius furzeri TaxID=105023 RepID=A0A8C6KXS1_NOTFU